MKEKLRKLLAILLGLLVVAIAFAVYFKTLAPTITAGDSAEMITAAVTLGIPHQSSYPLNTVLGHLFSKLPCDPSFCKGIAWKVNLMSAVLHSLTVGILFLVILQLYAIICKVKNKGNSSTTGIVAPAADSSTPGVEKETPGVSLGGTADYPPSQNTKVMRLWMNACFMLRRISLHRGRRRYHEHQPVELHFLAAGASLFLAFSRTFWINSLKAEVFPLNSLFASILLLLILRWWRKVDYTSDGGRLKRNSLHQLFHLGGEICRHLRGGTSCRSERDKEEDGGNYLLLFAFISGLGIAHHQTIALIIPACFYLIWKGQPQLVKNFFQGLGKVLLPEKEDRSDRTKRTKRMNEIGRTKEILQAGQIRKVIILAATFFFVGLSSYLMIIPMAKRNPPLNWGNPTTLARAIRSFLREDVGGFLAPAVYDTKEQYAVVEHLVFFVRNITVDFTFWGIGLGILGFYYLFKQKRTLFNFNFLGFIFSGPVFLVFANFPLNGDFAQATVLRFLLLPELFWTFAFAFGLKFIWEKVKAYTSRAYILEVSQVHSGRVHSATPGVETSERDGSYTSEVKPADPEKLRYGAGTSEVEMGTNLFARIITVGGLSLVFIFPLVSHFQSVDQRQNTFAYNFAKSTLSSTEDNAMILLSGDIPNFTIDYLRFVEKREGNRIIFSPGQLHMKWVVEQLNRRYPQLTVPLPYPGNRFAVTHQIIEANYDKTLATTSSDTSESAKQVKRPVYISPELSQLDPVVGQNYILWPKGLLFRVHKSKDEVKVDEFKADGEKIWQEIDPKKLITLTRFHPSLDNRLFFYYPRNFYNLGAMLEEEKLYEDAIKQYESVLELEPSFGLAYKALGVIYAYKLDEKKPVIEVEEKPDSSLSDEQRAARQKAIEAANEQALIINKQVNREKAIGYLYNYLQFAGSQEEFNQVKQAIEQLSQEEATTSGQVQEATESGEKRER